MREEQVSALAQIWTRSLDDADFGARLLADPGARWKTRWA